MGKKENPSEFTKSIRGRVLEESSNRTLHALARSIVDAATVGDRLRLSFAHEKHIEMIRPFEKELDEIFGIEVEFFFLYMLNEALSWGDVTWHFTNSK